MSVEYSNNLPELIESLRIAEQGITQRQHDATARASEQLRRVMQGVSHVKTGAMRDSDIVTGPYLVTSGTFETQIGPTVSYAAEEIARGGQHDYASRTLSEGADILDALMDELGGIVIAQITGR